MKRSFSAVTKQFYGNRLTKGISTQDLISKERQNSQELKLMDKFDCSAGSNSPKMAKISPK